MQSRLSFITILSSAIAVLAIGSSSAGAVTILATPYENEHDLHDILQADGYSHATSLADLNANESAAEIFGPIGAINEFTLVIEDAGYRDFNELGIYSASNSMYQAVLFDGSDDAGASASLVFDANGLKMVNGVEIADGFGWDFGFYLSNEDKRFAWFSEKERNSDGFDHFVAFEEDGAMWGAFEDHHGGGDEDFNDLVFSVRGVVGGASNNPIPEPDAALVYSVGLFVIIQVRRQRRKSIIPARSPGPC
jgi:hypothetical protein